jgi:hypothetical protein
MIDLATETPIYLADVPQYCPRHPRSGKRVAKQAIYRWVRHGVHGVRLEAISIGGTLATSVQALQRFCDACTAAKGLGMDAQPAATTRTSRQRQRAIEAAERELAESGI